MQYIHEVKVLEAATGPGAFDLTTLDEVKTFLNITTDTDDVRLQKLITFSSRIIAELCDRVFALEKVEETVTVTGTAFGMTLSRYPIISIEAFDKDGALLDLTSQVDIKDAAGGVLHGDFIGKNIITYTAGYDLPDEGPEPLSLACMDNIRAVYYFGSRDPSMQAITDNATGSIRFFPPPGMSRTGAPTKAMPLSPSAMALITPYRKLPLA